MAAREGWLDIVQDLILKYHCPADIATSDGGTPLHYSAAWDRLPVVQWLVTEGHATVDCRDSGGRMPLHDASYGGSVAVVEYLSHQYLIHLPPLPPDTGPQLHYQ